jgi:hypothetical protein
VLLHLGSTNFSTIAHAAAGMSPSGAAAALATRRRRVVDRKRFMLEICGQEGGSPRLRLSERLSKHRSVKSRRSGTDIEAGEFQRSRIDGRCSSHQTRRLW